MEVIESLSPEQIEAAIELKAQLLDEMVVNPRLLEDRIVRALRRGRTNPEPIKQALIDQGLGKPK